MAIKDDKIVHSAVGLGSILTVISTLLFWRVGMVYLVVLVPFILALGKEFIDLIRYGKFDVKDFLATINPGVIIKWYLKIIKK